MGLQFGNWTWWPNTLNAHRCSVYLEQLDAASALSEREKETRGLDLVKKYYELTYERGENISTPEGAAKALEELGFARATDATQWLQGGGGMDEVRRADSFAKRDMDIGGVPYFVISDETQRGQPVALSGAQSSSAFLQAFQQLSR